MHWVREGEWGSDPVYTKPRYDLMLTSYELFLGHFELMIRFCVDWGGVMSETNIDREFVERQSWVDEQNEKKQFDSGWPQVDCESTY